MKLRIKNSDKFLHLQSGLFSEENELELFLEECKITQDYLFANEEEAKRYCQRALYFGLIAELRKEM